MANVQLSRSDRRGLVQQTVLNHAACRATGKISEKIYFINRARSCMASDAFSYLQKTPDRIPSINNVDIAVYQAGVELSALQLWYIT